MHRLPTSSSSLPNPPSIVQSSSSSTPTNDPWGVLHVNLLPLFNGEPLRVPIENLNLLVRRHISSVLSSAPSKALSTLENDTIELLSAGMVTLNAKLSGIEDDKLISRVVELWGFFWDQVLTYVEGVLLPLQTDPLLSTLYRPPKRTTSPTRQSSKPSISSSLALTGHGMSPYHIDVRTVALRSFRDKIIVPLHSRLYTRLSLMSNVNKNTNEIMQETPPRMQQMLLVLSAQSRPRPQTLSLSGPTPPHLSQGEAAISDLLRIVRSVSRVHHQSAFGNRPRPVNGKNLLSSSTVSASRHHHPGFNNFGNPIGGTRAGARSGLDSRAPNFLIGATPRDRRGLVAGIKLDLWDKSKSEPGWVDESSADLETPKLAALDRIGFAEIERQRERDFLESLRSPEFPPGTPTGSSTTATVTARVSVGGWGLGPGNEAISPLGDGEEEELDWDQAQAVVERMVGMNHKPVDGTSAPPSSGDLPSPPSTVRHRTT
ncbi:hypothetical protein D9757_002021 [Collybiopsis confluens]|uniref:HbrB-domain-containing protein n=1 Tax=Collybiopsis confluens TaxID=2823264 RepID=A0A8H5HXV6_9AGAR|nr:hypothetical protein D9757_002021 [Collybiopsis confluens]